MSRTKRLSAMIGMCPALAGQPFRGRREGRWRMADVITVATALILLTAGNGGAANDAGEIARRVGERTPLFSAVTSQEALLDYNRDFYGRHHLVLSFFPAAFTPV